MQRRGGHLLPGLVCPSIQPKPGAVAYYEFGRCEQSYPAESFAYPSSFWVLNSKWMLHFASLSRMISGWSNILLLYLCKPMPNPPLCVKANLYTHPLLSPTNPLVQNGCFLFPMWTWNQPHWLIVFLILTRWNHVLDNFMCSVILYRKESNNLSQNPFNDKRFWSQVPSVQGMKWQKCISSFESA